MDSRRHPDQDPQLPPAPAEPPPLIHRKTCTTDDCCDNNSITSASIDDENSQQGREISDSDSAIDNGIDSITFDINAIDFDTSLPPEPQGPDIDFEDTPIATLATAQTRVRALIDSGGFASCTGFLHLLHNYTPYNASNPCPLRLVPATEGSDATPEGWGYLHVPAKNKHGFIPVKAYYTPQLRTTVIDERDIKTGSGIPRKDVLSENLHKNLDDGTCCIHVVHKKNSAKDVRIYGILHKDKPYTAYLIPPLDEETLSMLETDDDFNKECHQATIRQIHAFQAREEAKIKEQIRILPTHLHNLPFHEMIQDATPVNEIKAETRRLLWHQRLGHVSDKYLHKAHAHIKGVPSFKHIDPTLETCPTCIRAKQTKEPAGPNTTRTATKPYQGLSIDFSFAGVRSNDPTKAKDYVGINGETCWLLITDHYSRMKHATTRVSKASPLEWMRSFLKKHSPDCNGKYVFMDQGDELYHNPKVRSLFKQFGYDVRPTGADASNQNGPVERGHRTVADGVRALLIGADLDVQFWPMALHHWIRIDNVIPSRDQQQSPLELCGHPQPDFSRFRTFGCRVWVRPPGGRRRKFASASKKGIFLGFLPNTTRNIIWYNPETKKVGYAKHARFDEGMNDLPAPMIPPNVVHLQRSQTGDKIPTEDGELSVPLFEAHADPFPSIFRRQIPRRYRNPTLGMMIHEDELLGRAFVWDIQKIAVWPKRSAHTKLPLTKSGEHTSLASMGTLYSPTLTSTLHSRKHSHTTKTLKSNLLWKSD